MPVEPERINRSIMQLINTTGVRISVFAWPICSTIRLAKIDLVSRAVRLPRAWNKAIKIPRASSSSFASFYFPIKGISEQDDTADMMSDITATLRTNLLTV